MRAFRIVTVLALAVLIAGNAMAQEEKKKGKGARAEKAAGAKKEAGKRQGAQLPIQFLKDITLTEDQEAKLAEIKKALAPKFAEIRKKTQEVLTEEQQKARMEAMKAAREAGTKGPEIEKTVAEALNLTDEQKEQMAEIKKLTMEFQKELRAKVEEILTDEQKAALPKQGGKGAKGGAKKKK